MADFIDFEVDASDLSDDGNYEMEVDNPTSTDDAEGQKNNDVSFFRFFNQTRDTDEVLSEIAREDALAARHMEASNYNEYEHEETKIDEFEKSDIRREKFLATLENSVLEQTKENSFYSDLVFAIKFIKTENIDYCKEEQLKEEIGENLYMNLESKKIFVS